MVSLVAFTTRQHGMKLEWQKNTKTCWTMVTGSGLILRIQCVFSSPFELSDTVTKIQVWLVAPYKKPEADRPENTQFNNHVSMVRIRSEHAIGFLKGRFASLKHLRINIVNEATHIFATYWISACIGLHCFAMMCEDNENPGHDNADDGSRNPFIDEGLSSGPSDTENEHFRARTAYSRATQRLRQAKAKRERIKQQLFRALDDDWCVHHILGMVTIQTFTMPRHAHLSGHRWGDQLVDTRVEGAPFVL
jgi:DDE superfamily endonuclease